MIVILNTGTTRKDFESGYPMELGGNIDDTLPAGCPIMSTLFVVEKMAVVVSNGKDQWYREADKPADAGQPISTLFT